MPNASRESPARPHRSRRLWVLIVLALMCVFASAIRIRLLGLPLERDEGEYAYVGQLMLDGVPPYREAYTMKWPGTAAAYAVIMAVAGRTTEAIHAGLILVNLATTVMVFVITRRICGDIPALAAAGTYSVLCLSPSIFGLAAHATHFVMVTVLAGILVLLRMDDKSANARAFVAGVLFGFATLMKQPGAVFGLFAVFSLASQELARPDRNRRRFASRALALVLGALVPLGIAALVLIYAGDFRGCLQWTVINAAAYATQCNFADAIANLAFTGERLVREAPGLWAAATLGIALLFLDASLRGSRLPVVGFAVCSFLATALDGRFRGHYFLMLLPAAALLTGVSVHAAASLLARRRLGVVPELIPVLLVALAGGESLWYSRAVLFSLPPPDASRAIYGLCPFPEAVNVGRYLRTNAPPGARIAVLGSEPEIYFYSHLHSATGFIYTYPLMDSGQCALKMQEQMIREIEAASPEYIVAVQVDSSWLQTRQSPTLIFDWLDQYERAHYELAALVEILSAKRALYRWSTPRARATPQTDTWITIYKRTTPPGGPAQTQ